MKLRSTVNPPGRRTLAYRIATRGTLMEFMTALASVPAIHGTKLVNPIARLPMTPGEGFVPALFDAWATVGDVLTFYQERIANEGFVGTATDSFSRRQLIAMLGRAPLPALSATTVFAFTMSTAKGSPSSAIVPAGTPITASPPPDGSPAPVFETDADVVVRGEWNALPLVFAPPDVPVIDASSDSVTLAGADLGVLKTGSPLVVRRVSAGGSDVDTVVTIADVVPDAVTKTAFVRWTGPAIQGDGTPQFFAFRTSVGLFGANAPDWNDVPEAMKARYAQRRGGVTSSRDGISWTAPDAGTLGVDVVDVRFANGTLYALTAGAIVRADATRWTRIVPRTSGTLSAFAFANAAMYAGTDRGEVVVSNDAGASWTAVGAGKALAGIPIHALAVRGVAGSVPVVFAATDRGFAFAADDGSAWHFANAGFGVRNDDMPAPVAIGALAMRGTTLLAATSAGVRTRDVAATDGIPSGKWVERGIPGVPDGTPFTGVAFADVTAYAAGPSGLYRADASWRWARVAADVVAASPSVVDADGTTVIVAAPNGIAISRDRGATWSAAASPTGAHASAVSIARGSQSAAYAVPLEDYPADWPQMPLSGTSVDLERVVPALAPDAVVALVDARAETAKPAAIAARVANAYTTRKSRSEFPQTGLVTHVDLGGTDRAPSPDVSTFMRRTTRFYYDARTFGVAPATAAPMQTVDGSFVTIDASTTPLPCGRLVAVYGQPVRARVVGLAGGIRRIAPSNAVYGLAGLDVRSMAASPDGTTLYAGTTQDVWRQGGTGAFERWGVATDDRRPVPAMRAIAASPNAVIACADVDADASVAGRIFVRAADGAQWNLAAGPHGVMTVLAPSAAEATFYAGGAGLWRSADGTAWTAVTETGAPAATTSVTALAWAADGRTLLAGTRGGSVYVRGAGGTWTRRAHGLPNVAVLCIATSATRWWAGTDGHGVYAADPARDAWSAVKLALEPGLHSVRALAFETTLYAAVRGYGIVGEDAVLDRGIGNDVRGLVVRPDGVLAASRAGTVLATRSAVDQEISLRDVGAVDGSYAGDLGRGIIPAGLRAQLGSQVTIPAKATVCSVGTGRWLVSATPAYRSDRSTDPAIAAAANGMSDLLLRAHPVNETIIVAGARSYVLEQPPQAATPGSDGALVWAVRTSDGHRASFVASAGDAEFAPAGRDDAFAGESNVVASATVRPEGASTALAFATSLARVYDGSTVQLLGNCAAGSHGASGPTYEAIGNGDASQPNQAFALKRRDLSVLEDADGTLIPQIAVMVRPSVPRTAITSAAALRGADVAATGVVWRYVTSLAGASPEDRVYTLRFGDDGITTVVFGDGVNGSRLPTGAENVLAKYRSGNGPSGNIAAGSTLVMQKRSGGVVGVRNPVAASGGAAAQPATDALANAQAGLRALQRIVSLADLEDFAVSRTGIVKSKLRVADGIAYLTLVGPNGTTIDSGLKRELTEAIRGSGGAAIHVRIEDPERRYVRFGARLHVTADADRDDVAARALQRVRTAFAFERRALGEPLPSARVVETLQETPGVLAVTLTSFYEASWSAAIPPDASGDAGSATGAQLLLLDPDPSAVVVEAGP